MGRWDSSFSIVTMLQTGCPRKCGAIASKGKRFNSSPKSSGQLWVPHSPLLVGSKAAGLWN
jgi:hypothetical protein